MSFSLSQIRCLTDQFAGWHSQLPSWVSNINNAATLTKVLQDHIAAEAGRYKGKIYAWVRLLRNYVEPGVFDLTFEIGCGKRGL